MNRRRFMGSSLVLLGAAVHVGEAQDVDQQVLVKGELQSGYNMGVDDSAQGRQWLSTDGDHLKLSYPAGLKWGVVYITWDSPQADLKDRQFIDMSKYKSLIVEMRGGLGGETVYIGVKTNEQRDDGSETKIKTPLIAEWKEYAFPLSGFRRASPARLYVVTEVVFSGKDAQTVLLRNVRYSHAD
ncbi:MAG: hypothetical protein WB992_19305 [Bryobacteraceae bacterium]